MVESIASDGSQPAVTGDANPGSPLQPILVMMVYRGGARLARALASLEPVLGAFGRVVISVTSEPDSADVAMAQEFARRFAADTPPSIEEPSALGLGGASRTPIDVLCTGTEMPTMQHQRFWIDHLERIGTQRQAWILWLAYDDEVRPHGIAAVCDARGNWPLRPDTAYFGPWAMRHERADELWHGDPQAPVESWTSFPLSGPTRLPVIDWVGAQLRQPTYMQMSGSVCTLAAHRALVRGLVRKRGPMRIEMATALARSTSWIAEFPEPITIIYGRPNSDRASYGSAARREDWHLLVVIATYLAWHPWRIPAAAGWCIRLIGHTWRRMRRRDETVTEAWVCRELVQP